MIRVRDLTLAIGAFGLAASALLTVATSTPAEAAPSLSLRNSFRIGNAGVLCTAQSKAVAPLLVGMFDRGYSIVCRDAASAVGTMHALRKGKDNVYQRIARNRSPDLTCQPASTVKLEGVGVGLAMTCTDQTNQLAYRTYTVERGNVVYTAEGLGGYDSALQLGLRTLMADQPVKGEVQVASTSAGDPAAFARVQAGALDSESALAEAYSRNNDGAYAEAAEFFEALVERDATGARADARTSEYLANQALQESNQRNFQAADALFVRASTPSALADPIVGRLLRNFHAIHELNQGHVQAAVDELAKPVAQVTGSAVRDAALTQGTISPQVADQINRDNKAMEQLGGAIDGQLQPFERAQILDAQALQLRGVAYRIDKKYPQARESFAAAVKAMGAVREGKINSTGWLRSSIQSELALLAETEGNIPEAERLYADALQTTEINSPQTAVLLAARARFAGFLARHGQADRGRQMFADVVKTAEQIPGSMASVRNLLRPYFRLLADKAQTDPTAVAGMFAASQVMLRPGIAQTQALLARELSGGDDEASTLFRQSVTLTREIARTTGDVARMTAQPNPDEKDALDAARKRLVRFERDQTALQSRLAEFPRYRVLAPATMQVDELQKVLKPGDGYFKVTLVGQDGYAMFVTPTTARAYRIGVTTKQLEDMVAKIRDSVVKIENGQVATYPFDVALARKLYIAILGPADDELKSVTNFIYEPDGPLLQLPANLLPITQGPVDSYVDRVKKGGDDFDFRGIAWLGRDRDVSTVVSPRSFADGRDTAPSKAKMGYIGLGENAKPSANPFFVPPPALSDDCAWPVGNWNHPISSSELYLASGIIGADRSKLIVDDQFSDTTIEGLPDLSNYRIIHFATHGLVTAPRPECPARPALLTSFGGGTSDGLLSFKEIFDLKLDADVVVLSACDTAGMATVSATREAGITTGGNFALDGLVRAFVGAGARTVIASHWPVPDDYNATKRLITGLFTAPPGTPMATAMRKAQIGLMDDPDTSHPYYWSAFAIVGDGERPLIPLPAPETQKVATAPTPGKIAQQ